MSSESPVVEIFSSDGIELPVQNGVATPTNTRAILVAGSDGTNSRFISTNSSGQVIITGTVANTQSTSPWTDNITQFGGVNISTGTGASGTGIPRITVSNDSNILATQSGAWTTTGNQGTANTLANAWSVKITDATDPAIVIAVSPNNTVSTTAPTITKGTQAVNGWSVQNLKDAGRTSVVFMCSATAGVTTEALLTLTPIRGTAVGSTGTTLAVTGGKTLRLQTLALTIRNTSTVASGGLIRVRMLAGTVLVSSPVYFTVGGTVGGALAGQCQTAFID